MKHTDDLITDLAARGAAPSPHAARRFVTPLVLVSLLCAFAMLSLLGAPFLTIPSHGIGPMAVKWGFSLPLVLGAALALYALGQPGRDAGWRLAFLAIPFILTLLLLAADLALAEQVFPGRTWQTCLAAMACMSPLAFGGAIIATRWLAPTDLRRAGLVAGLFGGGVAMTAYAPFCPELGMAYFATFYLLPILAMAGLGWLLGPKLLHW